MSQSLAEAESKDRQVVRLDARQNSHAVLDVNESVSKLLDASMSRNTYATYRQALDRLHELSRDIETAGQTTLKLQVSVWGI